MVLRKRGYKSREIPVPIRNKRDASMGGVNLPLPGSLGVTQLGKRAASSRQSGVTQLGKRAAGSRRSGAKWVELIFREKYKLKIN